MKMKRFLAIIMSFVLSLSVLTGCGDSEVENSSVVEESASEEASAEESASEESSVEENVSEESSAEESSEAESTETDHSEAVSEESSVEESVEADPYAGLTFYESDTGISLYMGEGYAEETVEGVACSFNGPNNGITCSEELFTTLESVGYSNLTVEEYAQLLMGVYQLEGDVQTDEYGNVYFTYEQDIQGTSIAYYAFIDKGTASFWTTNFVCIAAEKELYEADFHLWASSIQVQ